MKNFVQYGAGNIGRGFIGQLFSQGGYDVRFIDVNMEVIDALNREKRYPVTVVDGDSKTDTWVTNVSGVDGRDGAAVAEAIAGADAMATAIGVNILPRIVPLIADGIRLRFSRGITEPLNIIICENMLDADKFLHGLILGQLDEAQADYFRSHIGLVEASIGRMVPVMTDEQRRENPLRVCVEKYCELPVDKNAFIGEIPEIPGIYPYSPFELYIKRKLYIHNMGHALTAYLGNIAGAQYIWQAVGDPYIKLIAQRAMQESAQALSGQFGFPLSSILEHITHLLLRFSNAALGDTVLRVGNDIRRKLSPDDRFAGAVKTCVSNGITPVYIPVGIAAALFFNNPDDRNSAALHDDLDSRGIGYVLENYCGISADSEAAAMVAAYYGSLKNNGGFKELLSLAEQNQTRIFGLKRII
ncbi:MAG: mannitol dehydrogenase family protein [Saccharofermentanales bacterium]